MEFNNCIEKMNQWGAESVPFIFIFDFDLKSPQLFRIDELPQNIRFEIANLKTDSKSQETDLDDLKFDFDVIDFELYKKAFDEVQKEISFGNSYLCNLTFQTRVHCNHDLNQIYDAVNSKYKLKFKDQFVMFSPETFVQLDDGQIKTFPMKGTIDAEIENAKETLLHDKKEAAEHATIVDLLRNDLSIVAKNVRVNKFKYIDRIETNRKSLLQMSSEVMGDLPGNYLSNMGSIIAKLLPAGSVTGAPKRKTVEIIKRVENYDRNYYTGIFGYFDGTRLDSSVMIRYIENINGELYYKSGGGITHLSKAKTEYQELIDKIYVPIRRNNQNRESKDPQFKMAQ